jgi:hypothetical protein
LTKEKSLHSAIRSWYFILGDRFEVKVDRYVVDIVRGDLLIEIQTENFSAVRKKLRTLTRKHRVRLVYPISLEKMIVHMSPSGKVLSRRRSPKKGRLVDLFDELVRVPDLFNGDNFSLEVLMVKDEEERCDDGQGSWRRRGTSIKDRKLISIIERAEFTNKTDFLRFLPESLPQPFTNRSFAESLGVPMRLSRKMTYSFRKMGLIREVGKSGRALLFKVVG